MAQDKTDTRLEEIQEEVDAIRKRLPHEPGFNVTDPDLKPLFPVGDEDEESTLGDV